jgi:PTS system galactitol-specific IIC component
MEGVMLVRNQAESMLKKKFPNREFYIGMDTSLLIGEPTVLATGLLLLPMTLLLAMVLPGNKMLPFADLSVLVFFLTMIAPYCKKNIFRMLITGMILMAIVLYISTDLTEIYTAAVQNSAVVLPENMRNREMGNMLSPVNTPVGWFLIKMSHILWG